MCKSDPMVSRLWLFRLARQQRTASPLKQQLGNLLRGGIGEAERTNLIVSALAIVGELAGHLYADVGKFLQKAFKVSLRDEVGLARFQGLNGCFVRSIGHRSCKSQYLTRLGDPQDDAFAFGGCGRDFRATGTKHKNSTCRKSFQA